MMVRDIVRDEEVVVVAVGTNNMGRDSSDMLKVKYWELLMRQGDQG